MDTKEIKQKQKELDKLYAIAKKRGGLVLLALISEIVGLELELEAECGQ